MRLAKDTRRTLDLAVEALIDLLDAIGPDPEAEPSLGAITAFDQEYAWDRDAGISMTERMSMTAENLRRMSRTSTMMPKKPASMQPMSRQGKPFRHC